jgi:hypothetical protein
LILLETYTTSEDSNVQKSLPQFLTIVQEVTGNPLYSMFNLSLREEWTTTKKFCHALQGMYVCMYVMLCMYVCKGWAKIDPALAL